MATADQIKTLIRSHFSEEPERFVTTALQVAAHEARQGHAALAHDIKTLVDKQRAKARLGVVRFPDELNGLILTRDADEKLPMVVLSPANRERIDGVLHEYRQRGKLKGHGMSHRRKILLSGPPGTGKTLTAGVLAGELGLPLRTIQVDRLVTKFMGETAAKLRQIFDVIRDSEGVFLFDEFDAIGGDRGRENDVGEMRRVLNSFLQFIESDPSDNVIVAATNNASLLDRALFRRFDDVLHYQLPDESERKRLMQNLLAAFTPKRFAYAGAVKASKNLSHAEIDKACRDAIKEAILSGSASVTAASLEKRLKDRQHAYQSP